MAPSSPAPASPSTAPSTQIPTDPATQQYRDVIHYISLGGLILCPILIALPPRKFDVYTISLLTGTSLGGNQILHEQTGRDIPARWRGFLQNRKQQSSPGLAGLEKRLGSVTDGNGGREERLPDTACRVGDGLGGRADGGEEQEVDMRMHEVAATWKRERESREREAFKAGRGYSDLIVDQIWEVWNWGKGGRGEG